MQFVVLTHVGVQFVWVHPVYEHVSLQFVSRHVTLQFDFSGDGGSPQCDTGQVFEHSVSKTPLDAPRTKSPSSARSARSPDSLMSESEVLT